MLQNPQARLEVLRVGLLNREGVASRSSMATPAIVDHDAGDCHTRALADEAIGARDRRPSTQSGLSAAAPSERSLGEAVMDAEVANCSASKHRLGQSVKFLAARAYR